MISIQTALPVGGRDARRLIGVGLWTAAGLVAVLLASGWLYSFDTESNESAERSRLIQALDDESTQFQRDVENLLSGVPKSTGLPNGPRLDDRLLLVDLTKGQIIASSGTPLTGAAEVSTEALKPLLEELQALPQTDQSGALVGAGAGAHIVVALRATQFAAVSAVLGKIPADRAAIVALRPISKDMVARLAATSDLPGLDVAPAGKADPASRVLTSGGAEQHAVLIWGTAQNQDSSLQLAGRVVYSILVVAAGLLLRRSILGLAAREKQAATLAQHDQLCGLPNRLLFTHLLDRELSSRKPQSPFALMYLDLDRFKEVNDRYGHDVGDRMLVAMTKRIGESLRATDQLGRLGGDEFAILQTNVRGPRDAEALARRVLESMRKPFDLGGQQIFAGVSIGIAFFPENASDRQELMHLADNALYRAKNEGRNRFAFFEERMGDELRRRKSYEDELAEAIDNGALMLEYQPLMSADGARMVGVEALVRWPHPVRGIIPPVDFIGLAEDRGLIHPLGEWVLRRACEDARAWPQLKIAVNVSPIQFRHKEFVSKVLRILDETGFDPNRLELELTESVVIDDAEVAEMAMIMLRDKGIRLALDDFGTGYSSLIYLRRFALDKIKIDRSFVQSLEETGESGIIVESITHMARALGLTVTAEGVETIEHRRALEALGCHELQGYYFSRPVSAAAISGMLDEKQITPECTAA
ncbi:MAG: hypothetical protein JWL62_3075 [Hyphomicrobiales bacterium]|nr:hypothetical protein [Hyphomicrobiales bacterium]